MPLKNLDPYLNFDGTCEAAFRFYEQALGAKIEFISTFAQSPMAGQVPASHGDKVMHAKLVLDGKVIMGSDAPPGYGGKPSGGFNLSLNYATVAEAKQAFAALSEGATIALPIDKAFWADAFGMLTDRFGTPWMVGCEKEA